MPAPTTTHKDILNQVALSAGVTYDTMLPTDKERWTSFANEAITWVWRPPNRMFAWKWSVATKTVTLTAGKFSLSEIDYSSWWNLWTQDPRPILQGGASWLSLNAYRVRAVDDSEDVWPQTTETEVFAFYRIAQPVFTHTAVAVATAYATGAIVFDDRTAANGGTGDCFKCVSGYTTPATEGDLTTDLANSVKWTRQAIPAPLTDAMAGWVDGIRRESLGQGERSGKAQANAEAWMQKELEDNLPANLTLPPWFYNSAGHPFDRFL